MAEQPDARPLLMIGDARQRLHEVASGSVHLTFTSPPYFNARDYGGGPIYHDYTAYLTVLDAVFEQVHRCTAAGRYLVVNTSPVLVPRPVDSSASESSRLAIPFDLHGLLLDQGWQFAEDVIWRKPLGAGSGRLRNWEHGHLPLTWKPELITEYLLAYRKPGRLTRDILLDYPPEARAASRMGIDFERSNVWEIAPRSHPDHPAVFPAELARRAIKAWTFAGDVVLDPFAGTGTTCWAAEGLGRRSIGIEQNAGYLPALERELAS